MYPTSQGMMTNDIVQIVTMPCQVWYTWKWLSTNKSKAWIIFAV